MALAPGLRLGVYEIVGLIGAGGMGEVYRARDTKLGRSVAIKVLPEIVAADADRIARFEREAKVLASLNHPHIAALYGMDEAAGRHFMVMEVVEGATLADRIARGRIPIDEALALAAQIADAVDAAHERGIVHRDLKPANIKLTGDGHIKVLDFGLAKLVAAAEGSSEWDARDARLDDSPTITTPAMTRAGVILGTAAYMSPEQARGRPADKRTDVWAFGCVLYEMLTGTRAFPSDDVTDALIAIFERTPDWTRLPADTPPVVRRLLQRCLEKDRRRRLRDIADARAYLDDALASGGDAPSVRTPLQLWVAVAAAALAASVVSGAVIWRLRSTTTGVDSPPPPVTRLQIIPEEGLADGGSVLALSPDGRRIAYAGNAGGTSQLFVRDLDQFVSKPVPGTEGVTQAAFSPDGQSMVFVADRKIRKIALAGGAPITLRDAADGRGLIWPIPKTIFFNLGLASGISRLAVDGSTTEIVTMAGAGTDQNVHPDVTPDGKVLLFSSLGGLYDLRVCALVMATGLKKCLFEGTTARYLDTGHLAWVQGGTLFVARFDPSRLDVSADHVAVLEGIRQTRDLALVAYSRAGTMAYIPADHPRQNTLVWVDRSGAERLTAAVPRLYSQPRLAPDSRRAAVVVSAGTEDVWLYDLERETLNRFTVGGGAFPVWTGDGRQLTFSSRKNGEYDIYRKPLDGSGPEETLLAGEGTKYPFSWSADSRSLVYVRVNPKTYQDMWLFSPGGTERDRPFLNTAFREGGPAFSPDGRWIAYVSDESGRAEVYVRPVPGPGERWTISADGGNEPVWTRNGRQIFYRKGDAMYAVDVQTSPAFSAGKARKLFEKHYEPSNAFWPNYDVTADGTALLMVKDISQPAGTPRINVVLNWFEELKQRVPAKP